MNVENLNEALEKAEVIYIEENNTLVEFVNWFNSDMTGEITGQPMMRAAVMAVQERISFIDKELKEIAIQLGKEKPNFKKVKVWELGDCDGVAAETLGQAIDWYMKEITDELDFIIPIKEISLDNLIRKDEDSEDMVSVSTAIIENWKGKPFIAYSTEY